ncbi:sulfite exporter TauE/SafE family protein [Metabacillus sp. RGM 3146]|uniref:sulfite exporter TauE/SafE family protein n=1 Tax=Metabacillus sp. RGM 3146 TaxID=3401092 RepID=UPI003B9ABBCC
MEWILLILIGFLAGTIGSLVGLGGGIIIVPALLFLSAGTGLLSGINPHIAVGTSLIVIIFTGLSSTLTYMKKKIVDYKSGLIFFIGSGPGSILGAWVNKIFNLASFSLWFGIFMIFVSIVLILKDKIKPLDQSGKKGFTRTFTDVKGMVYTYSFQPVLGILIAFLAGFFGGLFGIGGGSLMVPVMIIFFLFPPHVAVATSMLIIFLSSITSSITHVFFGNVNWLYALVLIPGAWYGGKAGALLNMRLESKTIVNLLRIVLIIVGIRLIYQGVS